MKRVGIVMTLILILLAASIAWGYQRINRYESLTQALDKQVEKIQDLLEDDLLTTGKRHNQLDNDEVRLLMEMAALKGETKLLRKLSDRPDRNRLRVADATVDNQIDEVNSLMRRVPVKRKIRNEWQEVKKINDKISELSRERFEIYPHAERRPGENQPDGRR